MEAVVRLVINSEVFFQNQIDLFMDTLILKIIFLIIKLNNFRGDLRDISAKTATLVINTGNRLIRMPGQSRMKPPVNHLTSEAFYQRLINYFF